MKDKEYCIYCKNYNACTSVFKDSSGYCDYYKPLENNMRKEIFESDIELRKFLKECIPDNMCLTDDEIVLKAKSLNLIKKSIVEEAEELSKKNKRLLSIMEILLSIETLEYHDKNFLSFQPCLNIMKRELINEAIQYLKQQLEEK